MQIAMTIIGIILILAALFLVVSVLMQSGKSHNLSGTIAGGAETFFGKTKGSDINKKLSKVTTVIAIIFVVLVLVSYLIQDNLTEKEFESSLGGNDVTITETDTSVETGDTVETEGESVEG